MKTKDELIFIRQVGEKIRSIREKKGVTQAYLALDCGVTQSTVCAYELGTRVQSVLILQRFAKSLGCSIKDFL